MTYQGFRISLPLRDRLPVGLDLQLGLQRLFKLRNKQTKDSQIDK